MWNEMCARILIEYVTKMNENHIKYFILRNSEGLPYSNSAKDIDIVIEPGKMKLSKNLLLQIFHDNDIEYFDCFVTGKMLCMHGISIKHNIGIHIDILEGLNIKGYELVAFDCMYSHAFKKNGIWTQPKEYEAFLTYLSKQFGQKKPYLKEKYIQEIKEKLFEECECFVKYFEGMVSKKYLEEIVKKLKIKQYDEVFSDYKEMNRQIKISVWKKRPLITLWGKIQFITEKINRILIHYRKHSRTFAILAPDGAGKSSLMSQIIEKINYYYVSEKKVNLYHFRPQIFPNLRDVGQKAKLMGEKETTTDPHKFKQAGTISSFFRMLYYIIDYVVGWQKRIRNDVHYDKYSAFDRYSYDLLVDPKRSRIKLPYIVRKLFVGVTPKPRIIFILSADADIIYKRKQELILEEIERQLSEYKKISKNNKKIHVMNAEKSLDILSDEVVKILFEKYAR